MALRNIGLKTSQLADAELAVKMQAMNPGEVVLQAIEGRNGAIWWKDRDGNIRTVGQTSSSTGVDSINGMTGTVVLGLNDLADVDTTEKTTDSWIKHNPSTGLWETSNIADAGYF